ncbi:transcriptional regulator [Oxyplasma meridianum]|uniref:Putative HTH-type transcriptional regulatory protein OXIME_001311 n=1 Tax=Oxyplasma meridianum TaxID=3073602 RepID=A0AAX4NIA9_9ARCH
MDDHRRVVIHRLYDILAKEGFKVSEPELKGLVSFDIVAKREDQKFILKVLQNIDTLRLANAVELQKFSKITGAAAMVVGEKCGSGNLEQGVVYYRHGVPILSLDTFADYMKGDQLYVYSGPGGFYISINGMELHRSREKSGMSIGNLSKRVGISRRSISLYESGNAATVDIFLKLEEILRTDFRKAIDLFNVEMIRSSEEIRNQDPFVSEFEGIIRRTGYMYESMNRSPFDVVVFETIKALMLVGLFENVLSRPERANAIKNVSDIFEQQPLIITREETSKDNLGGCPLVTLNELKKAYDPDDLIRLLHSKKSAVS